MLNWLNRKKSSSPAPATAHPRPPLVDWRNRENAGHSRTTPPGPERPPHRRRKLKALEVFSLVAVISLIIGVDIYIFGINKRLNALESEVTEVKSWAFPASLLEGKYASLNARVRALTDSYSGLEARLTSLAAQQQPVTIETRAAVHEGIVATAAEIPSEAPAAGIPLRSARTTPAAGGATGRVQRTDEDTAATAFTAVESQPVAEHDNSTGVARLALHSEEEIPTEAYEDKPVIPATAAEAEPPKTGPGEGRWVINLLSDPNKSLAERFANKARQHGVPVEQTRSEVKGRVFWRVQITGFETAGEARAHADQVKEKLRLKDVWIFKQQG